MSTSEDLVRKQLTHKRRLSTNDSTPVPASPKKDKVTPLSVFDLCDATARIAKKLLALGAENNWEDVQYSQGRSIVAGKFRENWLYLSRKDHGKLFEEKPSSAEKPDWLEQFREGVKLTFFCSQPKTEWRTHEHHIERNAAAAVLSLSGSCDQHAYVVATLLRAILPVGTQINICGLVMGRRPFPHTFVVVGPVATSKTPLNKLALDELLVVDAWPTLGGAVPLKDFFVCEDALSDAVLVVDKSYLADGKDHLIKRVSKQKILLDIIKTRDPDLETELGTGLNALMHHDLEEQSNYVHQIKRDRYLSDSPSDYAGMFGAPTISTKYKQSPKAAEAFYFICHNYPHPQFQRCLEYVGEKVKQLIAEDLNPVGDFTRRLNADF